MKFGQFISYYKAKRFIKKFYKNASSSSFCACKELSRTSVGNWKFWSKLLVLTLLWRRSLSYRNQSIDLLCKSMDWFLDDNGLRHERVKGNFSKQFISNNSRLRNNWSMTILTAIISKVGINTSYYMIYLLWIFKEFSNHVVILSYALSKNIKSNSCPYNLKHLHNQISLSMIHGLEC